MPATLKSLIDQIEAIGVAASREIEGASNAAALEELRIKFLGKKSELSRVKRQMKDVPESERPQIGEVANRVSASLGEALTSRLAACQTSEKDSRLAAESIDITLPGRPYPIGHPHPISKIMQEVGDVFVSMGFEIATGPDLEEEFYNFDALNIPAGHPSRDMHDTFYLQGGGVLRTHTTPVQIRMMKKRTPPMAFIAPGKVYRCENADFTHSPVFHQIDGFLIDKTVRLSDLKGVLVEFLKRTLGPEVQYRFRPSYFPFTEPSAELDIFWKNPGGEPHWMELLGSGMIHPKVLKAGGHDPAKYTGFAFGLGVERFAMIKYGIPGVRLFYENDLRFIGQF